MKKKISASSVRGASFVDAHGCSGGKLDLTWFTSKFTGKTAEDSQQEQESAAAEEAAARKHPPLSPRSSTTFPRLVLPTRKTTACIRMTAKASITAAFSRFSMSLCLL